MSPRTKQTQRKETKFKPGTAACTWNPNTQQGKAGGLQAWGQPGLPSETLSQDTNNRKREKHIYSARDSELEFTVSTNNGFFLLLLMPLLPLLPSA